MSSNPWGIPYKSSAEIREGYIKFFEAKDHRFVKSASVAPQDDPTLLFTNSGMAQFKGVFLGNNPQNLRRVVNSQKCLRVSGKHNDLEEVGFDGTHHTFFEMLGNWSFGDYYKKEAILWAWELLTKIWQLPKERLFATVHLDDDEAFEIWSKHTDIDKTHIMRFDKENFWEMGPVGPCGPCSEINFDLGDLNTQKETFADKIGGVNGSDGRYIEIWNLVFMQFERLKDGSLKQLAATHVDTGAGLERLCSVIQGQTSNYHTDLFMPIITSIEKMTGVSYHLDQRGNPHRVLADHIRTLCFAIADGAIPANDGRGYIIRRILRRASRFAHQLGQKEPFIYKLAAVVCEKMGTFFPEVSEQLSYIQDVIRDEEQRFLQTLDLGLNRINQEIEKTKKHGKQLLSGETAFLLHDTFGFPIDLTQMIAQEHGLKVNELEFAQKMEEQKVRARAHAKFTNVFASEENWQNLSNSKHTEFSGYSGLENQATVLRYLEDDGYVFIVLDKSPFYAEAGGQTGDLGVIENQEISFQVLDTIKVTDLHIHKCLLKAGALTEKSMAIPMHARVDKELRSLTMKNHSATHLLHASLRNIIGSHVKQQGSSVGPKRLRFDFTHNKALDEHQLQAIEAMVNTQIQNNLKVNTTIESFEEAKKSGAMALFGEKYQDEVRVLSMGEFSKELCGGTHVSHTGEIGLFRILSEAAIASGVRRLEAVTGPEALDLANQDKNLLSQLEALFKTPKDKLFEKLQLLNQKAKDLEKDLSKIKEAELDSNLDKVLSKNNKIGAYRYVVCKLDAKDFPRASLQIVLDQAVDKLADGVCFFTQVEEGQLSFIAAVGPNLRPHFKAAVLISEICQKIGAKGGGRDDKARAGTKEPEREQEVLELAEKWLQTCLSQL